MTGLTRTYPQPHEGIVGLDRTDTWLLSLDERAVAHRDAIVALTWHVHSACLVGSPAPKVWAMWERMDRPVPGDFVLVIDGALSQDLERRVMALGFLVAHRQEWAYTDDEHEARWVEDQAEKHPGYPDRAAFDADRFVVDDASYVQYGPAPADVCRWTNCMVRVAPIDRGMFEP